MTPVLLSQNVDAIESNRQHIRRIQIASIKKNIHYSSRKMTLSYLRKSTSGTTIKLRVLIMKNQ